MTKIIDNLPVIRIEDVRRIVRGRRRYNLLKMVPVVVNGSTHTLKLRETPANLGDNATQRLLCCERCNGSARVLRLVGNTLLCPTCLKSAGWRYLCQTRLILPKEKYDIPTGDNFVFDKKEEQL